jgi:hypothetical protein
MTVTKTPILQRETNVRYGAKADLAMIFAKQKDRCTAVSPKSDRSRMKNGSSPISYPTFASAG